MSDILITELITELRRQDTIDKVKTFTGPFVIAKFNTTKALSPDKVFRGSNFILDSLQDS